MEMDGVPSSYSSSVNFPVTEDIHYIEHKVQSMQLDHKPRSFSSYASHGTVTNVTDELESRTFREDLTTESGIIKLFQQFEEERTGSTFSRNCLFCRKHFTGNRSLLLNHLTEQHNFFMGHPNNLVYINEFLDILENMLNQLQCFYCEKYFKDWSALKEHMRKKMHKAINPHNEKFDKFYMENYLVGFSKWNMGYLSNEETEIEVEPKDNIICLFCDEKYSDFEVVMNHLKDIHGFDFRYMKKEFKLNFYSQVKLINFIRRKVLLLECIICDTPFMSKEALSKHLTTSCHIKILPLQEKWDQSEYFFSTLETDYLLCYLQDDDDEDMNVDIISEDIVIPKTSVLTDENLRRELL